MIPLNLSCTSEAETPFVTRLRAKAASVRPEDACLFDEQDGVVTFAGREGLMAIEGASAAALVGDVLLVDPVVGRAERVLRADSPHNTLLVTERCDQLCVMCSQPPKKTHVDRFELLEAACLLAEPDIVIGITGGEPTLYKEALFGMIERVLAARGDLAFHVLTNAQHFEADDIARLRDPSFSRVTWGIPLYASDRVTHDRIVGKPGAFERLETSLAHLTLAGARVELRTVLLSANVAALAELARYVSVRLRFITVWSIMQLENIGFARNRWNDLYVDHARDFHPIADALNLAKLHGIPAQLFNFPRCTVPEPYRPLAAASISDWKRKYANGCDTCAEQSSCSGFFEWHPEELMAKVHPL